MTAPVFSNDPREWRKMALLNLLGFSLLSSLLRWRGVLGNAAWLALLAVLAGIALAALIRPTWFRGWYRAMLRFAHFTSRVFSQVILVLLFVFVLTPLGLVLRLMGKDLLQLKRDPQAASYWHDAREPSALDRLF